MERKVVLICGPPGAGKTTLARSLGLRVFDRDDPQWRSDAHFAGTIKDLAHDPTAQAAVIRAGASSTSRKRNAALIRATSVRVLDVDADTCIRRVMERGRASAQSEVAGVRKWWATYRKDARYSPDAARAERQQRYGTEFQAARAYYKRALHIDGQLTCSEPICKHPNRLILPGMPWDLSHDPTGMHIIGPSHRQCNRSEAAVRGNRGRAGAMDARLVL